MKSKMTGILVCASYDDELLQKAIHTLKYKFVKGLAEPLSNLLAKTLKKNSQFSILNSEFLIIPVPLHLKRLKWRGFNQAQEFAWCLEKNLDLEVKNNVLIRSKYAKPQMQIKHHLARRKNIKNAFECIRPKEIKDKVVILIDDVCTTSATLEECAKALSLAKPKEIWGLVLARVQ
jgi:ComF family protein